MKNFLVPIILFCLSSLISCDVFEKGESIESGMKHIERYEFNEAINRFQIAIEKGYNNEEMYY